MRDQTISAAGITTVGQRFLRSGIAAPRGRMPGGTTQQAVDTLWEQLEPWDTHASVDGDAGN